MTLIITNKEVEDLITMGDCVKAMDKTQQAFGEGKAINAPPYRMMTPRDTKIFDERGTPQAIGEATGESDYPLHYTYTSLTGAVEPLGVTCDRIDSDGVYYVSDEEGIKEVRVPLSRGNRFCGFMLLWDADTGEPLAFIHDAVAQKMRVAATSALGTKYFAREDATKMALIGTGWQATTQIQAHPAVRDLEEIHVYSQTPEHRQEFVAEWSDRVGPDVMVASSARAAVEGADIVITATNSISPVVFQEWVEPGMYLTGVKDLEFESKIFQEVDKTFVNRYGPFWQRYAIGGEDVIPEEGRDMAQQNIVAGEDFPLLGEVAAGQVSGRETSEETITLINKGDGIQFVAIAELIYRRAVEAGAGHEIPTELFLQDEEYIP